MQELKETSRNQQAPVSSASQVPSISLPKGGGAILGIGEKSSANPVTGTGSMSVPIGKSPGRSGFGPQHSLSYDSRSGNGPYGFCWSLSLPSVTPKTDKGLPRYQDAIESDEFILSGAEDLVPVLDAKGRRFEDSETHPWLLTTNLLSAVQALRAYRRRMWTEHLFGDLKGQGMHFESSNTIYMKQRLFIGALIRSSIKPSGS